MTHIVTDAGELKYLVKQVMNVREFAFDVETVGTDEETRGDIRLQPRRNEVVWLAVATQGLSFVVPMGHPHGEQIGTKKETRVGNDGKIRNYSVPDWEPAPSQLRPGQVFEIMEEMFYDNDRLVVGHNIKFDIESCMKYYDDDVMPPAYFDTQIAAHMINENHHTYKLGDVVKREFGFSYDKSLGEQIERYGFKASARYAHADAKWTWLLYKKFAPQIPDQDLDGLWALEMDLLEVLLHMEKQGALLDEERARKLYGKLGIQLDRIKGELFRLAGGREINFNSTVQMRELLFGPKKDGGFGLKSTMKTRGGKTGENKQPSTSHDALELLQHPFVDTYLEMQEVDKIHGTYLKAYLGGETQKAKGKYMVTEIKPSILVEGKLHANFKQHGTVTGRFSCSSPNLQNIPRPDEDKPIAKQIRELFIAPPGHSLIVADYGQIEYIIMAHFSRDPMLVKAFADGVDLHQYVAAMVFGKDITDVTKLERGVAKNTNFACVPMDTAALTRRGWVSYDALEVGDDVMAYDGGVMCWAPVLEKVKYESAPVMKLSSGGWSVRTTPNHRWDTIRRTGKGQSRYFVREFTTSEDLTTEHSITTAAWADTHGPHALTPTEVAIIAWVHTDGSIRRSKFTGARAQAGGRRVGFITQIHQMKYKDEVELVLRGVPHLRSDERADGLVTWTLDSVWARDLWQRARLDEMSLVEFVLGLPPAHRREFLDACHLAEGHVGPTGQRLYTQNEGPVLEAMRVAVLLEGYMPRSWPKKITELTRTPCFEMSESTARVTGQRLRREIIGEEPVWCIRTKHENWVMRQGDIVALTGNTAYGAGDEKVAAMSKISLDAAVDFRKAHRKMLPKLYRWTEKVVVDARRRRPPHVKTMLGRKRRLPTLMSSNWYLRSEAERQAVNSTIQGSAADIIKLAMVRYHALADEEMPLSLSVHDELVAVVPDDRVDDGQAVMREAMLGPGIQSLLSVEMKIDMQVVKRWSEAKS